MILHHGVNLFPNYFAGDILENYCHNDDLINVARFLFAITIMLTYPIECFVTREVGIIRCNNNNYMDMVELGNCCNAILLIHRLKFSDISICVQTLTSNLFGYRVFPQLYNFAISADLPDLAFLCFSLSFIFLHIS